MRTGKDPFARKIHDGTGEAQAAEALQSIEEWKLEETVRAMPFDTTASNTGWEQRYRSLGFDPRSWDLAFNLGILGSELKSWDFAVDLTEAY